MGLIVAEKKPQKIKRVALFAFLFVFLFANTVLALGPKRTQAAPATQDPVKEATIYESAQFLSFCIGAYGLKSGANSDNFQSGDFVNRFTTDYVPGLGDVAKNIARSLTSDGQVSIGYSVPSTDDGKLNCKEPGNVAAAIAGIGLPATDLMTKSGIYEINDNKSDYDPVTGDNAVSAKKLLDYIKAQYPDVDLDGNASKPAQYFNLKKSFTEACARAVDDANGVPVVIVDNSGSPTTIKYTLKDGIDALVRVGVGMEADDAADGVMACRTIISQMEKLSPEAAERVKSVVSNGGTISGDDSNAGAPTCETSGFNLSWFVCPFVTGLAETSDAIFNDIIQPLLVARDVGYLDAGKSGQNLFQIWSSFRVIANVLLVVGLLVIVFGQAIGGGFVDAYTAKKALPRILVAAIMINISIYIVVFALDVSNVIGQGVNSLLLAPFRGTGNDLVRLSSGGTALITTSILGGLGVLLAAGGGIGGALLLVLLGIIIVVLAFLAVLVTLIIRQGIIILLVLVSPIAFALYILPNTEQYFRKWWNLLFKTLLVYPIVMCILGVSYMLAIVLDDIFPPGAQWVADLTSILLMVIPLFLVPFAFKMAGGAIGSLFGMLNNNPLKNLASGAAKKQVGKGFADSGHKIKGGEVFRGRTTGVRGAINRRAADVGHINKAGFRPGQWRGNLDSARTTTDMQEIGAMMEDAEYAPIKGDDNLNAVMFEWAQEGSTDVNRLRQMLRDSNYANGDEATIARSAAYAARIRRRMSGHAFEQMAVLQTEAGGTVWTDAEAWEAASRAAHGDMAAHANMVAKGRSASMGAGRSDVGGGSFGTTLQYSQDLGRLRQQLNDRQITQQQFEQQRDALSLQFQGSILESQGPGTILHPSIKPRAVEAQIGAMRQRIQAAVASGDQDQVDRELAVAQSLHDELSRTAPNKARIVADQLLRWKPGGGAGEQNLAVGTAGPVLDSGGPTVQELANSRRGSPVWQTTHKEFSDQFERQAAAAQAAAQRGGQQPPGGPPPPFDPGLPTGGL